MRKAFLLIAGLIISCVAMSGQPLPPPGPPGGMPPENPDLNPPPFQTPPPAPVSGSPAPGTPVPPPPPPAGWAYPGYLNNPPAASFNNGTINVMATGYDTESVLVQIPLVVSYSFNGAYYDVTVLNSWNPYTQTWNVGVDTPAYNTSYYFNGFNYNFYANLPSGTFYFNL